MAHEDGCLFPQNLPSSDFVSKMRLSLSFAQLLEKLFRFFAVVVAAYSALKKDDCVVASWAPWTECQASRSSTVVVEQSQEILAADNTVS